MNKSVGEIAGMVGGLVVGDSNVRITGLNGIKQAVPGDLTFIGSLRYRTHLDTTQAAAVLVTDEITECAKPLIQVAEPYAAFAQIVQDFKAEFTPQPQGVHPSAVVGENVRLGENVALGAHVAVADDTVIGDGTIIYAGCYVGHSCTIGADTILYPNVAVRERIKIGDRCIFHSGVVIGSDGFGFSCINGIYRKIPQIGTVEIGDDVEIGANSAVDRATFGKTAIGTGTKIDNLVQIGHNCVIGEHCVISGMSGLAGSTTVGDSVTVGAQAGTVGHLEIGDGVVIAARAGVSKSVKPGQIVSGFPAMDHNKEKRVRASERRLPEMIERLGELEKRIQELEG